MIAGLLAGSVPPLAGPQGTAGARDSAVDSLDPRIELIELQGASNLDGALAFLEGLRRDDPERAAALGIPYLHADLLARMERDATAARVFEEAITASPLLAPHARFRLAEWALEQGEPAAATAQLRDLLRSNPSSRLVRRSLDLFERALGAGGDCAHFAAVGRLQLGDETRRRFDLGRAICAARDGDTALESQIYARLLRTDTTDDVALHAADRWAARLRAEGAGSGTAPAPAPAAAADLDRTRSTAGGRGAEASPYARLGRADLPALLGIGLSYHHHREFLLAIPLLERALEIDQLERARAASGTSSSSTSPLLGGSQRHEARYALARSHFWLGRYRVAAKVFAQVASEAKGASGAARRSRALYQRARCFELLGREGWPAAYQAFGQARDASPRGGFAAPAMISRLRLAWLLGRQQESFDELERMVRAGKTSSAARGLLFWASSVLADPSSAGAQPSVGDPAAWVERASTLGGVEVQELYYWRGRAAESQANSARAIEEYLRALAVEPHHPFGVGSAHRLGRVELRTEAEAEARSRAGSTRLDHLHVAWLLLGDDDPDGVRARDELRRRLVADSRSRPFLELEAVPTDRWPLWNARLSRADERLLALGLFDEGGGRVLRHFPTHRPSLAYTGSLVLARAGATRRALYIAEILNEQMPDQLPPGLLPESYRQLLHPLRYSYLVLREAERRDIDPYLLAAIIREESRYDPDAFSGASARGLTQFVYPTARQIADRIEIGPIEARDIHRPEIAIALGAGYLEQLSEELDGATAHMVAAYNAGEAQSRLWRAYTYGPEPEEYLTKVAFRETRNYLRRVLRSRETYHDLYAREPAIGTLDLARERNEAARYSFDGQAFAGQAPAGHSLGGRVAGRLADGVEDAVSAPADR